MKFLNFFSAFVVIFAFLDPDPDSESETLPGCPNNTLPPLPTPCEFGLVTPTPFLTDGQEWNGVKFFQLSSHWQTHIKHFPVAVGTPLGYHSTD
jgi:hypothetical protein